MPMPPYPVLCYAPGCTRPAAFKVAARWSDGVTGELKTYSLACPDCLAKLFAAAVIMAYLPFVGAGWLILGFLPQYLIEEGFTGGGAVFYWWNLAKSILPLTGASDIAYLIGAGCLLAGPPQQP